MPKLFISILLASTAFFGTAHSQKNSQWLYTLGNHKTLIGSHSFATFYKGRLRYVLTLKKQGEYFYIIGGKRFGPYDTAGTVFCNDSKSACAIITDDNSVLFADGTKYDYKYGFDVRPVFNRKGDKWMAIIHSKKEVFVVVNGKKYGPYQSVDSHRFNHSGTMWKCRALKDGKYFILADGTEYFLEKDNRHTLYDEKAEKEKLDTTYCPDWNNWAYKIKKSDGWYLVFRDDKSYGPYKKIKSPKFNIDGTMWGFAGKKKGKWYVNILGNEQGPFDKLAENYFICQNNKWAIVAEYKKKKYVFIDNQCYGPFLDIDSFKFINNSWGFRAKINSREYVAVINSKQSAKYTYIKEPVFSEDGSAWGYIAENKQGRHIAKMSDGTTVGNDNKYPLKKLLSIDFLDGTDKWIFKGSRTDSKYAILTGDKKIYDVFDRIYTIAVYKTNWAFSFLQNKKYWVMINNKQEQGFNLKKIETDKSVYFVYFSIKRKNVYVNSVKFGK